MAKKQRLELTPEVKEAVLLLRYHKKKPKKTDATYMSLCQIGKTPKPHPKATQK